MEIVEGRPQGAGRPIAIVAARWNEMVVSSLVDGAVAELRRAEAMEPTVVYVPGAWEIPIVAGALVETGRFDGIVALGCIMQGQTSHAGLLASQVGSALMNLQTALGTPIGWGVLLPEDQDQAFDRAGLKAGNKGREAALACLETLDVLKKVRDLEDAGTFE
ncbi:MAG: 6,7-dimethyl-8-ribityllumazine synthase [Fimbriimonadaceae bacterium]|nr:6,7-dimethyl-8-ribityllumazine synthase [Fimbriimonadaceae bacterium]QYK56356.1 MAG: 6,7-dimethyl-8-ribityllumazine synthase [Fimbriimonadaceae bacterium]